MTVERLSSGAPWEPIVGYCRAVRAGNHIHISGTTSLDNSGEVFGEGDHYAQAQRCLQLIEDALLKLGASREHIVRTRVYVTDITKWELIGKAHGEFFHRADLRPAATMVEVSQLINPKMLVEIEADAYFKEED